MTYISHIALNTSRRETRRLLGNPQAMHAKVMKSFFPDDLEQDGANRVLWRVDSTRERDDLYIVSAARPDLTGFVEDAGWPTLATWQTREYGQRLNSLTKGQQWGFRLVANPTYYQSQENGRSKRLAHSTPQHQIQWLLGKAEDHGFQIADLEVLTEGGSELVPNVQTSRERNWKFPRAGKTVTVKSVQFDGVLTVTDPGAFSKALMGGIGAAKAYGCGLMTIAPLKVSGA